MGRDLDEFEHRLVAVLSADVAGYTVMMTGDAVATVRTLTSYRNEISSLVHQHRGRIVDAPGDNLLAEFESVTNAVVCATHVQHTLAVQNQALAAERQMRFRIGIHVGDVIAQEGRIYGDSVNVAARIQELAEPGGVRVSKAIAEQLPSGMPFELEPAGTHRLKNIGAPVQTFRVRDRGATQAPSPAAGPVPYSLQLSVPGFAGRPAIAVLRFQASGGSDDDDVFAGGIAEDLTTRLSAWRTYPVVACDSAAQYLPQADLTRVRNELHVRYVVKGNVQRAAGRARITAQLIDTDSAQIVWTQQMEENLGDLFEMQERIATSIASALEPQLRSIEVRRALRLPPASLSAWECVQRGLWHMIKQRREDHAAAEALYRRAIAEDPGFAAAHAFLGIVLAGQVVFGWSQKPRKAIEEAVAAAEAGLERDDQDPFVHRALGSVYVLQGKLERSIEANLKAVELNPSYALGHWGAGQQLALAGRATEGLAMLRTAMRLSPNDPLMSHFFADLAMAYFVLERYDECIEAAERSLRSQQELNWCWPYLIASLVRLERLRDAQRAVDQATPMLRLTLQGAALMLGRIGADRNLIDRLSSSLQAVLV